MNKRTLWLLALIPFLTYTPSLGNGFVTYDDDLLVYENPNVLEFTPQTIAKVFTTYDPELYVPITLLSYQIERAIFGLTPFIFHLTNLILHIGSVLLVYMISLRLSGYRLERSDSRNIAFAVAAIFALHPINAEAVAWIAARKDILSGFLFFASFYLYLKFLRSNIRRDYVLSLIVFGLSLGAKVSVVFLPVVLIISDWFIGKPIDKNNIKEKAPFFALSFVFGIIAILGKKAQIGGLTSLEETMLVIKGSVFYLQKLFWPSSLSILHPQDYPINLTSPDILIPLILLISLILILGFSRIAEVNGSTQLTTGEPRLRAWRRSPLTFGLTFFLLMLVPTFATFWKNGFIYFASERYTYTAVFGIIFAACYILVPRITKVINQNKSLVPVSKFAIIIAGLGMAFTSASHADNFKDGEAILLHALKINPDSTHALNNLGTTLYQEERYSESIEAYRRALEIDQRLPQVHTNLGLVLLKQNKASEAEDSFRSAIEMTPANRGLLEDELQCYFLLSQILEDRGNMSEALILLESAAEAGADYFSPHYNLGIKYQERRNSLKAYDEFKKATEIDKYHVDAHYRLAAVAAESGKLEEAVEALRRVVKLDAEYEKAKEHLENLERLLGDN